MARIESSVQFFFSIYYSTCLYISISEPVQLLLLSNCLYFRSFRGSALTGLICASCAVQGDSFLGISSDLYLLGYVASLATKLADTFASEIGKAYGKTCFLITTFERSQPGEEGAVSLEGTLAAVVGGLILSVYGYSIGLITTPEAVAISTTAAFVATNAESVLGATIQGKPGLEWVTNEVVNGINTLIGASLAIGTAAIFLEM